MTGCLLVQAVYWIATPLLLAYLVDEGLLRNDRSVLSQVVATLVVITVLGEAAGVAFDRLSARVSAELLRRLRQDMFDQLQRLSLRYYARNSEGDIVARFSADVTVVEELLASFVPWVVMPGLAVAGSTVALFALDWRLALLAMLVWPSSLIGPRCAIAIWRSSPTAPTSRASSSTAHRRSAPPCSRSPCWRGARCSRSTVC